MPTELRVATLNTWGLPFPLAWRARGLRFPRIRAFLDAAAHDLVGLQEVWDRSHRLLPGLPIQRPARDSGLAILSRLDGEGSGVEHHFRRATGTDALKPKGLLARPFRKGGRSGWFVVTHLQAGRSVRAVKARGEQVRELVQAVSALAGAVILVGDFNFHGDRAEDARSAELLTASGLVDAAEHLAAPAPTHPRTGQRFDRVYLRDGPRVALRASQVRVHPGASLSDHDVVEARVTLTGAG